MPNFVCPMCFATYEEDVLCECDTKLVPYKEYLKTADLKELKEVKKSLRLMKRLNEDDRAKWLKQVEDLIEAVQ